MPESAASVTASPTAAFLTQLGEVLEAIPKHQLDRLVDLLLEARLHGRRVYVFGNGGSAATASHFANDLAKTAAVPGFAPIRAFALTDNTPLLTAWANDTTFDRVFAAQLEGLLDPGDVAISISASGNSPNVVLGLRRAAELGARTVSIAGFGGGEASQIAELTILVPNWDYGLVEASHLAICHAVSTAIRQTLQAESTP